MHNSSGVGNQSVRKTGICTLFEGDYHLGLAAFVNSLVRAGYAGTVWAGYRGELPPWVNQLGLLDSDLHLYQVTDQVSLSFVPLDTGLHFTNYKPQFMLDLFAHHARGCEYLWYFDPDILLRCSWKFFGEWQRHGIALCQEIVNNILPADSPLRHQWMRVASTIGLFKARLLNHYFSGGMVGVSAAHISFLHLWLHTLERAQEEGCDLSGFQVGNREMPFYASDQDALNVAAMYTEHPLTTMGPEAMGFVPSGFTMYHAVGPKPWRASFLCRAIAGAPPSGADKFFLSQVSWPIRAYSPLRLRVKRLACSTAALIGRFYRRN
jgi:hypothetical protein